MCVCVCGLVCQIKFSFDNRFETCHLISRVVVISRKAFYLCNKDKVNMWSCNVVFAVFAD